MLYVLKHLPPFFDEQEEKMRKIYIVKLNTEEQERIVQGATRELQRLLHKLHSLQTPLKKCAMIARLSDDFFNNLNVESESGYPV